MTGEPRLVIFDCDGTLVDSQHGIVAAMVDTYAALGLGEVPEPERVRRIVGLSLVEAMAVLRPEASPDDHSIMAEAYREAFRAIREAGEHEEVLFPGVADTLKRLDDAGYLLGIATGKSRRGLLGVLERTGLGHYFVTLQTADDAPSKPHPEMVRRAIADCGTSPTATAMIGDISYDIEMARRAGATGIGVGWGYHPPEELSAAGAVAVAPTFADLELVLAELADRDR
ncbi:MAG: hypothetical protein CMM50_11575 [Rhodospirillaceae bacterium]|nr:hypothetical protein [Rhodospirillaceae bacterium]